jgi:hypothetical protein
MQQISFNIDRFKVESKVKTSHRAEIIKEMVDLINKERVGTIYKPVTGKGIAMKVSHIKDLFTLGWFLQEGKKQSSFSKFFFGKLKQKTTQRE